MFVRGRVEEGRWFFPTAEPALYSADAAEYCKIPPMETPHEYIARTKSAVAAFLQDWGELIAGALSFLVALLGGGWIKDHMALKRERQKQYQDVLEKHLVPLKGSFEFTRRLSSRLIGTDMSDLEYTRSPEELEEYFSALPNSDLRKYTWKDTIDDLHDKNKEIEEQINNMYGFRTISDELRTVFDDFKEHKAQWEQIWRLKEGLVLEDVPEGQRRLAEKFPVDLSSILDKEIDEAKQRAPRALSDISSRESMNTGRS